MLLGVMWMMTALVVGFMVGRISMYGLWDNDESAEEAENDIVPTERRKKKWLRRGHFQEDQRQLWAVGSPVSGEVMGFEEGERASVVIYPDSDRLYAPANGKITRLLPMGNSICFTTEFGTELFIQAGKAQDELQSCYYRPRVVRNEVVEKGKLLLEFDRTGLEEEGISAEVSVRVEQSFYGGEVRLTAGDQVAAGDDILHILEPSGQTAVTAG